MPGAVPYTRPPATPCRRAPPAASRSSRERAGKERDRRERDADAEDAHVADDIRRSAARERHDRVHAGVADDHPPDRLGRHRECGRDRRKRDVHHAVERHDEGPAAASQRVMRHCYDHTVTGLDASGWLLAVAGALAGSIVGGVAGFGAGITLLPILIFLVGVRAAIPVLTVTMLFGNLARVWWSRHDVNPRVALAFLAGAVPATALGAMLYAGTTSEWLARIIGIFMLCAVPFAAPHRSGFVVRLRHFPLVGAGVGALSSVLVATGRWPRRSFSRTACAAPPTSAPKAAA